MKKYLSVILEIILTACLVACGSSNKDSVNDDKQEVRLGKMNMPEREVVELLSNETLRACFTVVKSKFFYFFSYEFSCEFFLMPLVRNS